MDISFAAFWGQVTSNPMLMISVILTLAVIFVNGWTDAPNAIATCVTTRCMEAKPAILMAAVFNFLGVSVMTLINSSVAMTIKDMVNFKGENEGCTGGPLCRSGSHCRLGGGRLVFRHTYQRKPRADRRPFRRSHRSAGRASGGINGNEWIKVIYGLLLSALLGFMLGFMVCRLTTAICRNMDRRKTDGFFKYAQIVGASATAFMHGAQDGQKFMGVLILGVFLINGQDTTAGVSLPLWMMLLCSIVMGVGTSVGGKKIIKSVGMDMVKLEKYQGFSADIAASLCLLLSSTFGIPVSTTHTKTTAIMGVGAVKRLSAINMKVVKEMVLTWVLTFPGCGIIGFLMAKLFMAIF